LVFVGRNGSLEIARIGEPVGAQRPEFRQPQRLAVIFADVAARWAVRQLDAKSHATRDDGDLPVVYLHNAEFGDKTHPGLLWDDQHLAVRVVEIALGHRSVSSIDVDSHARLVGGATVAPDGD